MTGDTSKGDRESQPEPIAKNPEAAAHQVAADRLQADRRREIRHQRSIESRWEQYQD